MKDLRTLEVYRREHPISGSSKDQPDYGFFAIGKLAVLASTGEGWDHVSVFNRARCPTWDEMRYVKKLFFRDDEVAMQLHPTKKDYVNYHPRCLHLWRPQDQTIPIPPTWLVGPVGVGKR